MNKSLYEGDKSENQSDDQSEDEEVTIDEALELVCGEDDADEKEGKLESGNKENKVWIFFIHPWVLYYTGVILKVNFVIVIQLLKVF